MTTSKKMEIDWVGIERRLCKEKLSFFVKQFWSTIEEDELEWSWHMDVLCDEIQEAYERVFLKDRGRKDENGKPILERLPKLYDLIINIPPGTSKSTICTVMAPAWSWANDPSIVHITGSYSASLSTDHAVKSRDIIRSEKYKLLFPEVALKADQDNKTDYKNTRKGRRFATSITGTVTGNHAHIITIDDPLNPKQAASPAELEEANSFFDKTLPTRKKNKKVALTIIVMQRLAVNDPTGHIIEKNKKTPQKINHICLPGELSPVVTEKYKDKYIDGLLDPQRMGVDVLVDLLKDLGQSSYAGQIGQTPVPAGGLVWGKWFIEVPDEQFPDPDKADMVGNDWDLAYTDKEENAASAYVKAGKIKGKVYIFDFDWRWLEMPELIRWMKSVGDPHYIEAKASGKSAKQILKRMGIIAIEVQVKGGEDKVMRARNGTPIAEAGMVYIKKSMADRLYNDGKQGILFFPKGQYKDLADALAQCLQRLSNKGSKVLTDEPEEEDLLGDLDFDEPPKGQTVEQVFSSDDD
jgi:predicted phage terminase large subunit-like protein